MPRQQKKSGRGGWLFLALTLLAYMLLSLINPEAATKSLTFFTHVMTQVFPMLGLVFLLLFIANLLLEPKWIKRYLGKGSGVHVVTVSRRQVTPQTIMPSSWRKVKS